MSSEFTVTAKARADVGKGASRRLRRLANEVPAIVYGGDKAPQMISIPHKDLVWFMEDESFFSSVLNLDIDGTKESVVIKDLHRHPAKPQLLHADFLRVSADTKITLHVPLHFLNEESCHGVKMQGGSITHTMSDIEVICLPKDLPEFIEVDMKDVNAGQTLHISDLTLPAGVESTELLLGEAHDAAVVSVLAPRGGASSDDEGEGESEEA
ncbi:MAG: 50S ribosomal protein L25/general stress protein Ctc [Spongiibacter sp.]|uniref:Large ribosomal subunit protein bL25 n=1 Tax=Spongiibacter thalassae TaxID=2721624 RepID=A0ABX1GIA3_9GAMM|nr:50S ribosomal protein L25/general stress protein Ctc [Spongiibacter thalassae]MDX1505012.1 50S ribosomal protein L25/general stress protein Ctc [Spongiibacter sp.]NKI18949.1 50S ribosomal protein L25/general stress protein Ctc [Spongiibacter thalassae]